MAVNAARMGNERMTRIAKKSVEIPGQNRRQGGRLVRVGKVNVERFVSFPTIRFAFLPTTIRMPLFSHFSRAEEGEDRWFFLEVDALEDKLSKRGDEEKKMSKIKRWIIAAKKFPHRSSSREAVRFYRRPREYRSLNVYTRVRRAANARDTPFDTRRMTKESSLERRRDTRRDSAQVFAEDRMEEEWTVVVVRRKIERRRGR